MNARTATVTLVASLGTLVVSAMPACGNSAVGVDACRAVETARCQRVSECTDFNASQPVHRNGTDVDACTRFYHEACLHGLEAADPGEVATNACVAAIQNGDCLTVVHPEMNSACAWLKTSPDAGADVTPLPEGGGGLVGGGGPSDAATTDGGG
jgi:hypothetical protein